MFLDQIAHKKSFTMFLDRKSVFLDDQSTDKVTKFAFLLRVLMVLVKNLHFFHSLFFRLNRPKKVFRDVLNRKVAFLDDNSIKLKKWQMVQWFLSKN